MLWKPVRIRRSLTAWYLIHVHSRRFLDAIRVNIRGEHSLNVDRATNGEESRQAAKGGQCLTTCHLHLIGTSYLPRVHFDTVAGPHDQDVGPTDKEPAFDHTGNSVESRLKTAGIIDPRHVQIQDVVS